MIKQYTYVLYKGGELYARGFDENHERVIEKIDFSPTVWVKSTFNFNSWRPLIKDVKFNAYKSMMTEEPLTALTFFSVKDCNAFLKDNMVITDTKDGKKERSYGDSILMAPTNNYETQYMCEEFDEVISFDVSDLKIYNYDIETEVGHRNVPDDTKVDIRTKAVEKSFVHQDIEYKTMTIAEFESIPEREKWEALDPKTNTWVAYENHSYRYIGGFPDPENANEKITLITVKDVNDEHIYTWGIYPFVNERKEVTYFHCETEKELLKSFLKWWVDNYPDIMSGWNTSTFDNVYVANRIEKVLGTDAKKLLSPFGEIKMVKRNDPKTHLPVTECNWIGISSIDYLKLYKKFGISSVQESYKLDAIAAMEVGFKKVENPTGGSFKDFYTGVFDVATEPEESDHEIKKLGYKRTQLKKRLQSDPSLKEEYDALNEKIIQMCHQVFTEYNIRDVELVDKIDKKRKLIDLCITMAYKAHENYEDAFSPVKTWDCIIYNVQWRNGLIIPDNKTKQKSEKFEGAYVKTPLTGKHEFCESFDLDSLLTK